jgi:uncharacterized Zn-finger protein
VSDDARESCSARESSSPLATFLSLSENESADSVHSGLGFSFSAQQDIFPGYNPFDGDNLPYSPISDFAHPWDETQQQSHDSISVETTAETKQQPYDSNSVEIRAGSQDGSTSRHRCDKCNKSFADNNGLKRHVETKHEHGQVDWVCTVKSCGKYGRPFSRKDNFRRHCKTKHPMVNLKQFGL